MTDFRWRDSPDTIARLVNAEKIQTLSTQQVLLKPNEACAMIVDGRIGDILTETLLKSMAGGFTRWIGDKMGVTANDRRLLFAMTGPMDYWIPFEGQIANGENVKGYANLRLRMNLEDVPKLLNYFANNAPTLTRDGLISIISAEVNARVVTPCLASCSSAADLRDAAFLERFEMTAESEMRNILSNLGFTLLKAFPITNPTDMELVQKHRAAVQAKTAGTESNVEAQLAHYAQTEALTLARIELETNVAKAHARGQVTVQLESELKDLRTKEAHWEAERGHERGKMELRNDEADAKSKRAMDMFAEVQSRKADRISNQQSFQNQRMESQNDLQTKMMEMAANHGALTPEVMQEFLRQQTAQKAVDTTGGKSTNNSPTACSCGTTLLPGWKACPSCGTPIA
jgi:hypothetical protein